MLRAAEGAIILARAERISGMTWKYFLIVAAAGTCGYAQTDWIAEGTRALDSGNPQTAAADFGRALDVRLRTSPPQELVHLRVTLATAYLEEGENREAESTLQAAGQGTEPTGQAEILNAWSVLHVRRGQLGQAEEELREALAIAPPSHALAAAVAHNLAAVEMRTGRYGEALLHEQQAIAILRTAAGLHEANLIRARASLASLEFVMGQPHEAEASMSQAISSAEEHFGPAHPLLADLLDSDALILDKLKQKKQARTERARARAIRGPNAPASARRQVWNIHEANGSGAYLTSK